jgi:hypothetical protein
MVEVSDGVYLQGKELEEYCLKQGKCTKCAKVKVRKKVVKVFGSNSWEPITAVKVPKSDGADTGGGRRRRNKNKTKHYNSTKARIDSGNDDNVEYLVYKGFCLREGCYTLDQAKRLSGCADPGIGIGPTARKSNNVFSSNSSLGSAKSLSNKSISSSKTGRIFGKPSFLRKSSKSVTSGNPNNPFLSPPPPKHDKHPLLGGGIDSPGAPNSVLSPMSAVRIPGPALIPSDEVSSVITGSSLTEYNNHQYQQQEKEQSPVVPSPEVRKHFEHEFTFGGGSPPRMRRFHSRDLYQIGSIETDEASAVGSKQPEPVREIVRRTVSALQGLSAIPVIHTLDLTGLRFRRSEMEALAKLFKAGKNGTVHLTSLVLDNCGIDDGLLGILGQALYDALWTANNRIGQAKDSMTSKMNKSMRHARMRLKSLYLGDNDIGNFGIVGLCPYLESIACELEYLDLSRNNIETNGGVTLFDALRRNPQTKILGIDLSCNILRELEGQNPDGSVQLSPGFPGQPCGIHGFLVKNRTLKELDLSANRMTNEGVETLFRGLSLARDRTVLQKLNLGYNRIGNRGAKAIGKCLMANQSLLLLELNDNHIQNDGGEFLFSAMRHNTTLKEISGLWSNKIEKRHIVVSIRQILVDENRGKKQTKNIDTNSKSNDPKNPNSSNNDDSDNSESDIYITDSESTVHARNVNGDDISHDKEAEVEQHENKPVSPSKENPAVEANENILDVEDDGNVSDLSDQEEISLSDSYERLLRDIPDKDDIEVADGMMETNQEVTHNMFDRVTVMNASPLVCFDDKENNARRGISLQDTRLEIEAIKAAVGAHNVTRGSRIEVKEEMATTDKFKAFFSGRDSAVLHLSCNGLQNGLALEDGYGSLETLSLGALKALVSGSGGVPELVFISSSSALQIGTAFLNAGVKHVVCCQRDSAFRDPLALEFTESFYAHAGGEKTLRESFEAALKTAVSSTRSRILCQVTKRFRLLPLSSADPPGPVFFQRFIPHHYQEDQQEQNQWNNILPPPPDYFVGREIEIFRILEALQITNCVEISGNSGCGKECVLAASLEYALKRNETFSIEEVCWIPAPKEAMVDPDSLYGDLILCCDLISDSSEDLWDRSEEVLDCRERLAIELEGAKIVVVIDNRSFCSTGSRTALEKLVNFIVTYTSSAKVICISTSNHEIETSDYLDIKTSRIEIDALNFRSTVRLFGEVSEHVSRNNGLSMAWSAKEFSELADLPFSSLTNDKLGVGDSNRRADIFERIGKGGPAEVVSSAKNMSRDGFDELMKIVRKPEINVGSQSELQSEVRRRNSFLDLSIKDRNYNRAAELHAIIVELDGMKTQFSSLKDLKAEEKLMKLALAEAVSSRRYDLANELKRDMLVLKKKIMKERRNSNNRSVENQKEVLSDLKAQVDSLADTIEQDVSMASHEEEILSFNVDCDGHTCKFLVYSGNVLDTQSFACFSDPKEQHETKGIGVVCWSNEACELEGTEDGQCLLEFDLLESEAERFKNCLNNLPVLEETRNGSVRCMMGSSLILNPQSSIIDIDTGSGGSGEMVVILTVGPFASPSGQIDALLERDNEYHRFGIATLRSCYRSCLGQTHRANLHALAIRPLTTRTKNGPIYEEILKVAVRTIVEETKFSSGLREVHLLGKTAKEALLLAGIIKSMGYSMRVGELAQG